jgi:hypothetical protein
MGGKVVKRDRLKKLVAEKRFIPGVYNYCDRWCERCPLTSRCLNFSISQEDPPDPEAQDIRNEAFWNKLSETFAETLEMLKEGAKEWGIDLDTVEFTEEDTERLKAKDRTADNHLLSRAAKRYIGIVDDWCKERETLFFETAAAAREGVNLEEAFEVIRWYQYFISAKVIRAVGGKVGDDEEGDDEFPRDSDGSAKIALIAMDRSISAWAVIRHYVAEGAKGVIDAIAFLDSLRQAVEKTFPNARSFVRPGFDSMTK